MGTTEWLSLSDSPSEFGSTVSFSLTLPGWGGLGERRCGSRQWVWWSLPLVGAKRHSGQSRGVCTVSLPCFFAVFWRRKKNLSERRKGNRILGVHVPGPFAVVCTLRVPISFPRSLPVLCCYPRSMRFHPVGKQAVPLAPAQMPVHGLAIKRACPGSCHQSFRGGNTSPPCRPVLPCPSVGTLPSPRSRVFDFSGVCYGFIHCVQ